MPGRAAMSSVGAVKADITSTRMHENDSGVSGSDTSAIGGEGRKGGAGEGDGLTYKSVIGMMTGGGNATTGETGVNSGFGKRV